MTLGRDLIAGETVTAPLAVSGAGIDAGDYTLTLATGAGLNTGVTLDTDNPHGAARPAVVFTGADAGTQQTATLTVTAIDDSVSEATETLTVGFGAGVRAVTSNLDRASGAGTGGTRPAGTARVQITDNDTPVARFASAASSAGEGAGTHNVRVDFTPVRTRATVLGYTVGGTAARGSGADFMAPDTVTVAANASHVNIPVTIRDDLVTEGEETVVLTLTDGADHDLGGVKVHTLTIADNDGDAMLAAQGLDLGGRDVARPRELDALAAGAEGAGGDRYGPCGP